MIYFLLLEGLKFLRSCTIIMCYIIVVMLKAWVAQGLERSPGRGEPSGNFCVLQGTSKVMLAYTQLGVQQS